MTDKLDLDALEAGIRRAMTMVVGPCCISFDAATVLSLMASAREVATLTAERDALRAERDAFEADRDHQRKAKEVTEEYLHAERRYLRQAKEQIAALKAAVYLINKAAVAAHNELRRLDDEQAGKIARELYAAIGSSRAALDALTAVKMETGR